MEKSDKLFIAIINGNSAAVNRLLSEGAALNEAVVEKGSYAEKYCKRNGIGYTYKEC